MEDLTLILVYGLIVSIAFPVIYTVWYTRNAHVVRRRQLHAEDHSTKQ